MTAYQRNRDWPGRRRLLPLLALLAGLLFSPAAQAQSGAQTAQAERERLWQQVIDANLPPDERAIALEGFVDSLITDFHRERVGTTNLEAARTRFHIGSRANWLADLITPLRVEDTSLQTFEQDLHALLRGRITIADFFGTSPFVTRRPAAQWRLMLAVVNSLERLAREELSPNVFGEADALRRLGEVLQVAAGQRHQGAVRTLLGVLGQRRAPQNSRSHYPLLFIYQELVESGSWERMWRTNREALVREELLGLFRWCWYQEAMWDDTLTRVVFRRDSSDSRDPAEVRQPFIDIAATLLEPTSKYPQGELVAIAQHSRDTPLADMALQTLYGLGALGTRHGPPEIANLADQRQDFLLRSGWLQTAYAARYSSNPDTPFRGFLENLLRHGDLNMRARAQAAIYAVEGAPPQSEPATELSLWSEASPLRQNATEIHAMHGGQDPYALDQYGKLLMELAATDSAAPDFELALDVVQRLLNTDELGRLEVVAATVEGKFNANAYVTDGRFRSALLEGESVQDLATALLFYRCGLVDDVLDPNSANEMQRSYDSALSEGRIATLLQHNHPLVRMLTHHGLEQAVAASDASGGGSEPLQRVGAPLLRGYTPPVDLSYVDGVGPMVAETEQLLRQALDTILPVAERREALRRLRSLQGAYNFRQLEIAVAYINLVQHYGDLFIAQLADSCDALESGGSRAAMHWPLATEQLHLLRSWAAHGFYAPEHVTEIVSPGPILRLFSHAVQGGHLEAADAALDLIHTIGRYHDASLVMETPSGDSTRSVRSALVAQWSATDFLARVDEFVAATDGSDFRAEHVFNWTVQTLQLQLEQQPSIRRLLEAHLHGTPILAGDWLTAAVTLNGMGEAETPIRETAAALLQHACDMVRNGQVNLTQMNGPEARDPHAMRRVLTEIGEAESTWDQALALLGLVEGFRNSPPGDPRLTAQARLVFELIGRGTLNRHSNAENPLIRELITILLHAVHRWSAPPNGWSANPHAELHATVAQQMDDFGLQPAPADPRQRRGLTPVGANQQRRGALDFWGSGRARASVDAATLWEGVLDESRSLRERYRNLQELNARAEAFHADSPDDDVANVDRRLQGLHPSPTQLHDLWQSLRTQPDNYDRWTDLVAALPFQRQVTFREALQQPHALLWRYRLAVLTVVEVLAVGGQDAEPPIAAETIVTDLFALFEEAYRDRHETALRRCLQLLAHHHNSSESNLVRHLADTYQKAEPALWTEVLRRYDDPQLLRLVLEAILWSYSPAVERATSETDGPSTDVSVTSIHGLASRLLAPYTDAEPSGPSLLEHLAQSSDGELADAARHCLIAIYRGNVVGVDARQQQRARTMFLAVAEARGDTGHDITDMIWFQREAAAVSQNQIRNGAESQKPSLHNLVVEAQQLLGRGEDAWQENPELFYELLISLAMSESGSFSYRVGLQTIFEAFERNIPLESVFLKPDSGALDRQEFGLVVERVLTTSYRLTESYSGSAKAPAGETRELVGFLLVLRYALLNPDVSHVATEQAHGIFSESIRSGGRFTTWNTPDKNRLLRLLALRLALDGVEIYDGAVRTNCQTFLDNYFPPTEIRYLTKHRLNPDPGTAHPQQQTALWFATMLDESLPTAQRLEAMRAFYFSEDRTWRYAEGANAALWPMRQFLQRCLAAPTATQQPSAEDLEIATAMVELLTTWIHGGQVVAEELVDLLSPGPLLAIETTLLEENPKLAEAVLTLIHAALSNGDDALVRGSGLSVREATLARLSRTGSFARIGSLVKAEAPGDYVQLALDILNLAWFYDVELHAELLPIYAGFFRGERFAGMLTSPYDRETTVRLLEAVANFRAAIAGSGQHAEAASRLEEALATWRDGEGFRAFLADVLDELEPPQTDARAGTSDPALHAELMALSFPEGSRMLAVLAEALTTGEPPNQHSISLREIAMKLMSDLELIDILFTTAGRLQDPTREALFVRANNSMVFLRAWMQLESMTPTMRVVRKDAQGIEPKEYLESVVFCIEELQSLLVRILRRSGHAALADGGGEVNLSPMLMEAQRLLQAMSGDEQARSTSPLAPREETTELPLVNHKLTPSEHMAARPGNQDGLQRLAYATLGVNVVLLILDDRILTDLETRERQEPHAHEDWLRWMMLLNLAIVDPDLPEDVRMRAAQQLHYLCERAVNVGSVVSQAQAEEMVESRQAAHHLRGEDVSVWDRALALLALDRSLRDERLEPQAIVSPASLMVQALANSGSLDRHANSASPLIRRLARQLLDTANRCVQLPDGPPPFTENIRGLVAFETDIQAAMERVGMRPTGHDPGLRANLDPPRHPSRGGHTILPWGGGGNRQQESERNAKTPDDWLWQTLETATHDTNSAHRQGALRSLRTDDAMQALLKLSNHPQVASYRQLALTLAQRVADPAYDWAIERLEITRALFFWELNGCESVQMAYATVTESLITIIERQSADSPNALQLLWNLAFSREWLKELGFEPGEWIAARGTFADDTMDSLFQIYLSNIRARVTNGLASLLATERVGYEAMQASYDRGDYGSAMRIWLVLQGLALAPGDTEARQSATAELDRIDRENLHVDLLASIAADDVRYSSLRPEITHWLLALQQIVQRCQSSPTEQPSYLELLRTQATPLFVTEGLAARLFASLSDTAKLAAYHITTFFAGRPPGEANQQEAVQVLESVNAEARTRLGSQLQLPLGSHTTGLRAPPTKRDIGWLRYGITTVPPYSKHVTPTQRSAAWDASRRRCDVFVSLPDKIFVNPPDAGEAQSDYLQTYLKHAWGDPDVEYRDSASRHLRELAQHGRNPLANFVRQSGDSRLTALALETLIFSLGTDDSDSAWSQLTAALLHWTDLSQGADEPPLAAISAARLLARHSPLEQQREIGMRVLSGVYERHSAQRAATPNTTINPGNAYSAIAMKLRSYSEWSTVAEILDAIFLVALEAPDARSRAGALSDLYAMIHFDDPSTGGSFSLFQHGLKHAISEVQVSSLFTYYLVANHVDLFDADTVAEFLQLWNHGQDSRDVHGFVLDQLGEFYQSQQRGGESLQPVDTIELPELLWLEQLARQIVDHFRSDRNPRLNPRTSALRHAQQLQARIQQIRANQQAVEEATAILVTYHKVLWQRKADGTLEDAALLRDLTRLLALFFSTDQGRPLVMQYAHPLDEEPEPLEGRLGRAEAGRQIARDYSQTRLQQLLSSGQFTAHLPAAGIRDNQIGPAMQVVGKLTTFNPSALTSIVQRAQAVSIRVR